MKTVTAGQLALPVNSQQTPIPPQLVLHVEGRRSSTENFSCIENNAYVPPLPSPTYLCDPPSWRVDEGLVRVYYPARRWRPLFTVLLHLTKIHTHTPITVTNSDVMTNFLSLLRPRKCYFVTFGSKKIRTKL